MRVRGGNCQFLLRFYIRSNHLDVLISSNNDRTLHMKLCSAAFFPVIHPFNLPIRTITFRMFFLNSRQYDNLRRIHQEPRGSRTEFRCLHRYLISWSQFNTFGLHIGMCDNHRLLGIHLEDTIRDLDTADFEVQIGDIYWQFLAGILESAAQEQMICLYCQLFLAGIRYLMCVVFLIQMWTEFCNFLKILCFHVHIVYIPRDIKLFSADPFAKLSDSNRMR